MRYFLSVVVVATFLSEFSFASSDSKYCVGFAPVQNCQVVKTARKEMTALVKALKLISYGPLKGQMVEDFAVANTRGDHQFVHILEGTFLQEITLSEDHNSGGRPGYDVQVLQTISNVVVEVKEARGARYFEITYDRERVLPQTGSPIEPSNTRVSLFDFCGNEFTGDLDDFPTSFSCSAY